ncbi:MAG TPA: DUF262 domain-containing HNH endonuclease family protein [Candidatus Angelobacter sp.]|nr:DUF262 domain-containing HNH endonuclease family protein [Candidatus Angelobacter sp.]
MNASAVPLLNIFEKKMRLEVPLFQRQYVWNREVQWEPLWEDISRKFTEYLEGRKDSPVHFLGAMVLDQKQTPTTHVERRQVIDGQQRLTTLQIFLAAFRDFCSAQGCSPLAQECENFTLNKGMMADPAVDRFKVWPTQLDRAQFRDVMTAGSRSELETKHPLVKRKYARTYEPRPKMVEAYIYFYDELVDFFIGTEMEPPIAAEVPISSRLEESFTAFKNALRVVVIDLEKEDDAQVIFETLNARGEPLLPADLLRNFIFLRAARMKEPQEQLYAEYWSRFDDPFWRTEVRQGRLSRPRSDLFMQHFLASKRTVDIPIKHLFVEYKFWIDRDKPFPSIKHELAALARQGDDFRRIIQPTADDLIYPLATFLEDFDVRTAYPLLLHLLDLALPESGFVEISEAIESYLLRRSVCNLGTKNYNRIFLGLLRHVKQHGTTSSEICKFLSNLSGESTEWPSDEAFSASWLSMPVYNVLQNPKLVHILRRLNDTYMHRKLERIRIEGPLTVEHILPQNWRDNWPFADGMKGLSYEEVWQRDENDPAVQATRNRDAALQRFGNLTIVTQELNSAVSNGPWETKKPALLESLLPINQRLRDEEIWDEEAINRRSKKLLERALQLWKRPAANRSFASSAQS